MKHLISEQASKLWKFALQQICYQVHRAQHYQRCEQVIAAAIDRFRPNFFLLHSKPSTRQRHVRTEEKIIAVPQSFEEDDEMSIYVVLNL